MGDKVVYEVDHHTRKWPERVIYMIKVTFLISDAPCALSYDYDFRSHVVSMLGKTQLSIQHYTWTFNLIQQFFVLAFDPYMCTFLYQISGTKNHQLRFQ